jgi:D-glycero-D-manno-heptose 1,7-bisphosphate phosphatase
MTVARRQAIFLDRDGVLIRSALRDGRPVAVTCADEVEILDGVEEACSAFAKLGFLLVMITNQPDIARKCISEKFVHDTNSRLKRLLALDAVELCPHDDGDGCDCRKPKPGLITRAAQRLSINLTSSIVVGDRWRDIEAGKRAGCRTILVDWGHDEDKGVKPDHIVTSLLDAVELIRALRV